MTAPFIRVRSAPSVNEARVNPSLTGVLNLVGDTQWGLPQKPTFAATMGAWITAHGPLRVGMNIAQVQTWLAAFFFYLAGGEGIFTTRAHAMVNSVDPDAGPTGLSASGTLSRSASTLTAASLTGERQGPFTTKVGDQMTITFDVGEGGEHTQLIQNGTFLSGTFAGSLDMTSVGSHLFMMVNGVLQDLAFTQGAGEDQVPDETTVTLATFAPAFNSKMATLGFHSRIDIINATSYRFVVADASLQFSRGVDELTAADIGLTGVSEAAVMDLDIGADTVDITTDSGTTTTIDIGFDVDSGDGVEAKIIQILAADVGGDTATADIDDIVTKINATESTTGIRAFATGTGATKHMLLVVDQTGSGVADIAYDAAQPPTTVTFDDTSLNLDAVTADTGVVAETAPTSLTATEAKDLIEAYFTISTDAVATVEGGSQVKITHLTPGAARNFRVDQGPAGFDFAAVMGFPSSQVTGTDSASALATLDIAAKYVGTMGNAISCIPVQPVAQAVSTFDLEIYLDSVLVLTLQDIGMDTVSIADASNAQNFVNLSVPVVNTGLALPDMGTAAALTGGTAGDAVTKEWYMGTSINKRGFYAMQTLDDREFPDMILSVDFPCGTSDGNEVQAAMCTFVAREDQKERTMAFTSWQPGLSEEQFVTILIANAAMTNPDLVVNHYGAYTVTNPERSTTSPTGPLTEFDYPASPHVAGRISAGDRTERGGIHKACAGIQGGRGIVTTALGVEVLPGNTRPRTADPEVRKRLATFRAIWSVDEGQVVIGDVVVAGIDGNYNTIPARRGHTQLFKNMRQALKRIQFLNVDDDTIEAGADVLTQLLDGMLEENGFASKTRSEAYRVDSGPGVNTDATRKGGEFRYRVFTAPVEPGRFVEVQVSNKD